MHATKRAGELVRHQIVNRQTTISLDFSSMYMYAMTLGRDVPVAGCQLLLVMMIMVLVLQTLHE